jgi:hypothetical protein
MPQYLFQNPKNGKIIEINQAMTEDHKYIDEQGLEWKRVYTIPTGSVKDKKIDLRYKKDRDLYNSVYKKRYEYNKKKGKI